jgi:hypothetical protein
MPRCTFDVRNFHGLESFFRKFIKKISGIWALLIECMKKVSFQWTSSITKSFETLKKKVTKQPMLALLKFNKVFQLYCNAHG